MISLIPLLLISLHIVYLSYVIQQIFDCDWSPKRAPSLDKIFTICKKIVAWLKMDKRNVVVIQCQVCLSFSN